VSDTTDFLYATARIRALEMSFINYDRMERMLTAKTNDEALTVLAECGYGEVHLTSSADIESIILNQRLKTYDLIEKLVVDRSILDIFKIRYDYHNIKVIIKSADENISHLLINTGRIDTRFLEIVIRESDFYKLNTTMAKAVVDSREVLSRTGNPQLSDFILDRAAYAEMLGVAEKTNSRFILNYVKLLIDVNNLRSFIRCSRMNKGSDLLKNALFEGGEIDVALLIAAVDDASFKAESIYALSKLENAATVGDSALNGEKSLTVFEKVCDDVLVDYLKSARYVSFGEQPIFAYVAARESEFMTVRTIFSGRLANVDTDLIRERLRKAYV
jgi:V/A-type H+-transporting ATPase subunit C